MLATFDNDFIVLCIMPNLKYDTSIADSVKAATK